MTETNEKKYDLEERTARFGEDTIMFAKTLEKDVIMMPLISQLVRAATSVGANYMEANQASSKRDFRNKEANETKHWLRMISKASPAKADDCRKFWKEAHELTLIFSKIATSLNDTKV